MMDKFKVFIALISCKKNIKKAQACKETWLSSLPPNYEFRIFTADENSNETVDDGVNVVLGGVHDDYEHLPEKVINAFDYINKNFEYDYIAKIDDDVYFNPVALDNEDFDGYDYIGGFYNSEAIIKFPAGPAYFISKNVCNIITSESIYSSFPLIGAEDREIALSIAVNAPEIYYNYNNIAHKYFNGLGYVNSFNMSHISDYAVLMQIDTYIAGFSPNTLLKTNKHMYFIHNEINKEKILYKLYYINKNDSDQSHIIYVYNDGTFNDGKCNFFGTFNKSNGLINFKIELCNTENYFNRFLNSVFSFIDSSDIEKQSTFDDNVIAIEKKIHHDFHTNALIEKHSLHSNVIKATTKFLSGWTDSIYYYQNGTVTDRYANESCNHIIANKNGVNYIFFQDGSVKKFIFCSSSNCLYEVPMNPLPINYSFTKCDNKTVGYIVKNPIDVVIHDNYIASIKSFVKNGFNVKLFIYGNIEEIYISDFFNQGLDNIEIIDAKNILDIDECNNKEELLSAKYFNNLFYLALNAYNIKLCLIDETVFYNSNGYLFYGTNGNNYINVNFNSNYVNDIKDVISIIASIYKISDSAIRDASINAIIEATIAKIKTDNNTQFDNTLFPSISNDVVKKCFIEFPKNLNDKFVKYSLNNIPVLIFDKSDVDSEINPNINLHSYIGQFFI